MSIVNLIIFGAVALSLHGSSGQPSASEDFYFMKESLCGIYKITSPSGHIYIGQSVDIQARLRSYRNLRCKGQRKLYHSILKYGWNRHFVEYLHLCKQEHLNYLEDFYIRHYNTFNTPEGLNLQQGGSRNYRVSDETRKIKSALFSGKNNPQYGKKCTVESNNKRRAAQYEIIETTRERSRITSTGRVYSQASRDKKSKSLIGHSVSDSVRAALKRARSKIVYQYSIGWLFIKEWPSVKVAQLELGCSNISNCCLSKSKTSGGFKWSYNYLDRTKVNGI